MPSLVGLSNEPMKNRLYSPTAVWDTVTPYVIADLSTYRLNLYRMSFRSTCDITLRNSIIQTFLDNCRHNLIVDYFHWGSDADSSTLSAAEWTETTNRALALMATFSAYEDRLFIEPYNEQRNSVADLVSNTQAFINAIRNAGYHRVGIVANIFWQLGGIPIMAEPNIVDPDDRFWTGQHVYISEFGATPDVALANAKTWMQEGLNAGLKLIITEVGGDPGTTSEISPEESNALKKFMQWCMENDIGTALWTSTGGTNYYLNKYVSLGFTFPQAPALPYHNPLTSLDNLSIINGTWSIQ